MRNFKIFFLLITFNFLLITPLFAQMEWICATDSAGWSIRYAHTSVVFDNKIWVAGGDSYLLMNDVWFSSDGVNWTNATPSAGWAKRLGHSSVVFNNKIWVLGGWDEEGRFRNDAWYSSDGINWTQATASAQWKARALHTSVMFGNNIWMLGGTDSLNLPNNDVWYSADGVNWTQATHSAGWSPRNGHSSIIFDNKIWVLGGCDFIGPLEGPKNDVWFSSDGINWTQAIASAEWTARAVHTSVVFDNKIWVIGGIDEGGYKNDVWYSTNGVDWIRATDSAGWMSRFSHTSVVFDDKLWVLGGWIQTGTFEDDVWYSRGLGIEENGILDAKLLTPEIYPNPARSFLAIRLPQTADRQAIKIFDVSGKLVKVADEVANAQERKQEVRISLKRIRPGIYFLRLGKETKKFLVVK